MEKTSLLDGKIVESVLYTSNTVTIKFTDGTAAILGANSYGAFEFEIGTYEFKQIWEK